MIRRAHTTKHQSVPTIKKAKTKNEGINEVGCPPEWDASPQILNSNSATLVAHEVERQGGTREEQLWGLLHDASEAYLVDIPSPLKRTPAFAAYREAEEIMMVAICNRFNLPLDEPDIVRAADVTLLGREARDLMPFRPEHWGGLPPVAGKRIIPWGPFSAKDQFIFAYEELST